MAPTHKTKPTLSRGHANDGHSAMAGDMRARKRVWPSWTVAILWYSIVVAALVVGLTTAYGSPASRGLIYALLVMLIFINPALSVSRADKYWTSRSSRVWRYGNAVIGSWSMVAWGLLAASVAEISVGIGRGGFTDWKAEWVRGVPGEKSSWHHASLTRPGASCGGRGRA